jgi:hypothetical protein
MEKEMEVKCLIFQLFLLTDDKFASIIWLIEDDLILL